MVAFDPLNARSARAFFNAPQFKRTRRTWVDVPDVGGMGIVRDTPAVQLPPNAWSNGKNVRFSDGKVRKSKGNSSVLGAPLGLPLWGMWLSAEGTPCWLYADKTRVYSVENNVHSNRTRTAGGSYTTNERDRWVGGLLGGIVVLTNGYDIPQSWVPSPTNKLENLANWPSTLRADIIRPFNNYLVAANLRENDVHFQHRVRWSHPATPGTLPSSWDISDKATDAGEFDLTDERSGEIVDGAQLRDVMLLYKVGSVWQMRHVGGQFIFNINQVFNSFGAMSQACVAPFSHKGGEFHCVMTEDDVVIHDGREVQASLERTWRNELQDLLNAPEFYRSFVVNVSASDENWVFFPSGSNDWPNLALIWNYESQTITLREVPERILWAAMGTDARSQQRFTWDTMPGTWDSLDAQRPWNKRLRSAHRRLQLFEMNSGGTGGFTVADEGDTFAGENMTSFIERRDITLAGRYVTGEQYSDIGLRKLVNGIRPRLTLKSDTGRVDVMIGASEHPGQEPDWYDESPLYIDKNTDFSSSLGPKLDCHVQGRFIHVRFESTTDVDWELEGYELDISVTGEQ